MERNRVLHQLPIAVDGEEFEDELVRVRQKVVVLGRGRVYSDMSASEAHFG